jgi:hypothetical protein
MPPMGEVVKSGMVSPVHLASVSRTFEQTGEAVQRVDTGQGTASLLRILLNPF